MLRKIIRRALTHGRLLGQTKPFLNEMVFAVRDLMQDAYPELIETCERVAKTVLVEETRFGHTMNVGLEKLEALISENRLSGPEAFKLYDTFGMPLDFMQDAARDQGIEFDQKGFDAAMTEQRERARASWKGAAKQTANPCLPAASEIRHLRAIDKLVLTTAKSLPSSTTAKAPSNSIPETKAKSSSTTLRSTPNPAAKSATADGSTATITTRSSPK